LPQPLGEIGHDRQGVVPKRVDLDRLADARRHHPIADLGVHPGELHARFAGMKQPVGRRPCRCGNGCLEHASRSCRPAPEIPRPRPPNRRWPPDKPATPRSTTARRPPCCSPAFRPRRGTHWATSLDRRSGRRSAGCAGHCRAGRSPASNPAKRSWCRGPSRRTRDSRRLPIRRRASPATAGRTGSCRRPTPVVRSSRAALKLAERPSPLEGKGLGVRGATSRATPARGRKTVAAPHPDRGSVVVQAGDDADPDDRGVRSTAPDRRTDARLDPAGRAPAPPVNRNSRSNPTRSETGRPWLENAR
jgi:hypothetical protein